MYVLSREETLEKIAALEAAADLGKILSHKWHSHIAGGLADHRSPADFPREDLLKGMVVEMEHTSDPSVACEIAMDHLMEDQHYYNHEQDMAKEVREKLGHLQLHEDGAIKIAEMLGSRLAGMYKEAGPLSAIKSVGSRLLGKAAPRAIEAAVPKVVTKGIGGAVAHGAESSVGKVLPFQAAPSRMGTVGPRSSGISGLERTNIDLHPVGAAARTPAPIERAVQHAVGQPMQRMPTAQFNARKEQYMQSPSPGREGADALIRDPKRLAEHQKAMMAKAPTQGVAPARSIVNQQQFDPIASRTVQIPNQPMAQIQATPPPTPQASVGSVAPNVPSHEERLNRMMEAHQEAPIPAEAPGRVVPAPHSDPRINHLLEHGTVAPASVQAAPAAGAIRDPGNLRVPERETFSGPHSGSSISNEAGFHNAPGHVVPNESVVAKGGGGGSEGGPQTKRFGMGKVLGYGALAGAGYGLYKGVPAAARMVDQENSMPLAYGGGWSPTPYGYGSTPYGPGMPTMGAG